MGGLVGWQCREVGPQSGCQIAAGQRLSRSRQVVSVQHDHCCAHCWSGGRLEGLACPSVTSQRVGPVTILRKVPILILGIFLSIFLQLVLLS